jgi:hypothetical protein
MANKNQRRVRGELAKARRAGAGELAFEQATHGYHNNKNGAFVTRRIPIVKYVHKARKAHYQQPEEGMSLINQRIFLSYQPKSP